PADQRAASRGIMHVVVLGESLTLEHHPMKLVIGAALTLVALGVPRAIVAQDQKPVLSGRWTYNDSLSDKARDALQGDSTGKHRARRGGGGGGRGGMGGGRGGM